MSKKKKKLLIVSGSAPGSGHVGEIILRDLILHYGCQNVSFAAIASERYNYRPDPRLSELDMVLYRTELVNAPRRGLGGLATIKSEASLLVSFPREMRRLEQGIVEQAKRSGAELVLFILNSAPTIALGAGLARSLDRPMLSLVWDAPDYVLRSAGFARFSRRRLLGMFEQAMAGSKRVAVVSDNMRDEYSRFTSAEFTTLRHGRPLGVPSRFGESSKSDSPFTLGFAGAMYGESAWKALLAALDRANWTIRDRSVQIKLMGKRTSIQSMGPAHVEYLGFRPDSEVDRILASCDVCYLQQPFETQLSDFGRYSFPTKLGNYLSTGRPVFVHSPPGSALGDFFEKQPFGVRVASLQPEPIIAGLSDLADPAFNELASKNALAVARQYFTVEAFHRSIDEFLEVPDGSGAPAPRANKAAVLGE